MVKSGIFGRSGDENLLGASVEVLGRTGTVDEESSRLEDDVNAPLAPLEIGWVTLRRSVNLVTIDDDRIVVDSSPRRRRFLGWCHT